MDNQRRVLLTVLLTVIMVILGAGHAAALERVDDAWLQQNLDNVVVVDGRSAGDYEQGHIPGAINLTAKDLRGTNSIAHPVAKQEEIIGGAGIDGSKPVVVYGGSYKEWSIPTWIFDWLGLDVKYLNGGIKVWTGDLSTEATSLPAVTFRANADPGKYATVEEVRAAIDDPNIIILDSRSPDEHSGKKNTRALRGGNIPGSVNFNYVEHLEEDGFTAKPLDEIEALYAPLLDKNKKIVPYCQTGTRSTSTYVVLRELGYDVANFDASWIVWGSDLRLPVENETWFDFRAIAESGLPGVEQRVAALEEGGVPATAPGTQAAGPSLAGPYLVALIAVVLAVAAVLRRPASSSD